MIWSPDGFETPRRVELSDGRHRRPIRAADVEIDYPVVMAHREKLWAKYGGAWGWPPAHMTMEQDREDLQHHEDEIRRRESFNYAVLPAGERELDQVVPRWLEQTWAFGSVDYSP